MAKQVSTGSGLFFLHKSPEREKSCRRFRKFPFRTPFCKGKLRISMQPYVSACRWGEKCIFMSIRLLIPEWSLQLFHLYVFDNSRFVELNCDTNMISYIEISTKFSKNKSSRIYSESLELVAGEGLEPSTSGLWARRATNCSTPRHHNKFLEGGTGDRTRTGTRITSHRILSPRCLPIPPLRLIV